MRRLHSFDAQSKRLEALGVVAVGMVHDFEIMTMSIERALADAEPESNLCKNLQLAYNSCKRAARLGRTLQGLAKDSCPHDSAGSLAPLIRESVGAELAGADIVLEYQLKDPLPTVAHNAAQMRTVFTQLVSNARKAMPSGGTLRISGEGCSVTEGSALPLPAGQYLHVCVGDSGVGIAPEDLASIFDPYWSSDPMGCRSGMGLGLTVCYSIIKKHHGLIAAESELGRGATIHIYLPAAE
jgi:signal transduction histidine kinase